MKPLILVASVLAFEFAFVASVATPPAPAQEASLARAGDGTSGQVLAQQPVPCTPRG